MAEIRGDGLVRKVKGLFVPRDPVTNREQRPNAARVTSEKIPSARQITIQEEVDDILERHREARRREIEERRKAALRREAGTLAASKKST